VRNFPTRILLAAVLTLVASALASSAQAQQADEDPAPATPRQQQPTAIPESPQPPQVPAPSSGDAQTNEAQTQQALAFTGRIANEEGHLVLKDPVTKMSYQLNEPSKANPYLGKKVKVVGKLEMKSNTIHIESIEPLP
jgi:type IV pilus biogenesis protein CpaD/CtpE